MLTPEEIEQLQQIRDAINATDEIVSRVIEEIASKSTEERILQGLQTRYPAHPVHQDEYRSIAQYVDVITRDHALDDADGATYENLKDMRQIISVYAHQNWFRGAPYDTYRALMAQSDQIQKIAADLSQRSPQAHFSDVRTGGYRPFIEYLESGKPFLDPHGRPITDLSELTQLYPGELADRNWENFVSATEDEIESIEARFSAWEADVEAYRQTGLPATTNIDREILRAAPPAPAAPVEPRSRVRFDEINVAVADTMPFIPDAAPVAPAAALATAAAAPPRDALPPDAPLWVPVHNSEGGLVGYYVQDRPEVIAQFNTWQAAQQQPDPATTTTADSPVAASAQSDVESVGAPPADRAEVARAQAALLAQEMAAAPMPPVQAKLLTRTYPAGAQSDAGIAASDELGKTDRISPSKG